jgi:hypothetical protein
MRRRGYDSYLSKIIILLRKTDKGNKIAVIISLIILFVAVITILKSNQDNMIMQSLTQQSAENSSKSAQIANIALNETKKLVNWTEPKPNIQIWSDVDFWGKNGTAYVQISPFYSPYKGVNEFNGTQNSYWGPMTIDFLVFNSGKAPVAAAVCYIGLSCNETKDVFPFKIFNISTPLQSLSYNTALKRMELSFMNYFHYPYWQWNEQGALDFPPTYLYGEVVFRHLLLPFQNYIYKINYSQDRSDYQNDSIGPFAIGNIEPGETKHVYVSLFGVVSDYYNLIGGYWTEPRPFAHGTFTIKVKSTQSQMANYSFPIESYFRPP